MSNVTRTIPTTTIEQIQAHRVSCDCGWWSTYPTQQAAQGGSDEHRYASRCNFCGVAQDDHDSLTVKRSAGDPRAEQGLSVFCPSCVI